MEHEVLVGHDQERGAHADNELDNKCPFGLIELIGAVDQFFYQKLAGAEQRQKPYGYYRPQVHGGQGRHVGSDLSAVECKREDGECILNRDSHLSLLFSSVIATPFDHGCLWRWYDPHQSHNFVYAVFLRQPELLYCK